MVARPIKGPGQSLVGAAGQACLANLAQGTLCKIPAAHEIKPQKMRCYLERRDPELAEKMAEVLVCLSRGRAAEAGGAGQTKESPAVAIISYDEKLGVQALATAAPDLPPEEANRDPSFALGLTKSIRPHDMSRSLEAMY